MLKECIDALNIVPDGVYVDATFGGGGHSAAILERLGEKGKLFAFDRDADAFKNKIADERLTLIRHNYRYIKNFMRYYNVIPVNGVLADLGISSHQVDEPARGFSLRFNANLDMRMNQEGDLTASDVINNYDEEKLVSIFSGYGEVFNAKTLARRIIASRKEKKIISVNEFRLAIHDCADRSNENQYYAKVFQALRIEVNDELGSLKDLLANTIQVLAPKGRLVVISYHSLEDRLVKNVIAKGKFEGEVEKDLFGNPEYNPLSAINKKPLEASAEEVKNNPRARSAKLRIAERN